MSNEETHEYKYSKERGGRGTEDKRCMALPSLSVSYSQHEIVWRWASSAASTPASPSPRSAAAAASELTEEGEPSREKKKESVSLALPWDFESGDSDLADGVTRRFDCSGWYSNWRGE